MSDTDTGAIDPTRPITPNNPARKAVAPEFRDADLVPDEEFEPHVLATEPPAPEETGDGTTPEPEPDPEPDEAVVASYEEKSNDALQEDLAARGLPTSGNKHEMAVRLAKADLADDQSQS